MAGKSFFMHKNSAGLCTNSLHKSALLFCNKQTEDLYQEAMNNDVEIKKLAHITKRVSQ